MIISKYLFRNDIEKKPEILVMFDILASSRLIETVPG